MNLVGLWEIDKADRQALAAVGDVVLDFGDDGVLVYAVRGEDSAQIFDLRYHVEGNVVVTDQPSAPRVERTAFAFADDGSLTLAFGDVPCRFLRLNSAD
jgi:hypothetical protein